MYHIIFYYIYNTESAFRKFGASISDDVFDLIDDLKKWWFVNQPTKNIETGWLDFRGAVLGGSSQDL